MQKSSNTTTIALLTDIHGNYPALKALLQYFDSVGVDSYINLGDIVDIGAYSKQCLDTMLNLDNCTNLMGNHDWDFVCDRRKHLPMSHTSGAHKAYVFDSIGASMREVVGKFPHCKQLKHGNITFAFAHYALATDTSRGLFEQLVPKPTAELLDETFANMSGDIIFYGHKHEPSTIVGSKVYYDVGSVGCHRHSVARGGILTLYKDGQYNFERISVPYDRDSYKQDMTNGQLPDGKYLFDFYLDRIEARRIDE